MYYEFIKFFKLLSTFAINIISVFIPAIIYGAVIKTDPSAVNTALFYAVSYLILFAFLRIFLDLIFKKWLLRYQKLFIIIRIITVILYFFSVSLIEVNFIAGIVLAALFHAFSLTFTLVPENSLYATMKKDDSNYGRVKIYENIGNIIGIISGGLILQYLDQSFLLIFVLIIYSGGAIPLFIKDIKEIKRVGLVVKPSNEIIKEDNAVLQNIENEQQKLGPKFILCFWWLYFL